MSYTIPLFRKDAFRQFVKFGLVGVSNTLVDLSVYIFLTRSISFFGANIYLANAIAFSAAATWSYYANKRWTFRRESGANAREMLKFYATVSSGFLLSTLALFLLVSSAGIHDIAAKIATVAVSVVWNFSLAKFWVFKK